MATLQRMERPAVVVVELPEDGGGSYWILDAGAGAATVVVVAMDGEMGSPNEGAFLIECMTAGSGGGCSSWA